jgi:hypothetical protein
MSEQKIVTASLEGMRILVDEKQCELQEYDFVVNEWRAKDAALWPLGRDRADAWLAGWNDVDRFAAVNLLTEHGQEPMRSSGAEGSLAVLRPDV